MRLLEQWLSSPSMNDVEQLFSQCADLSDVVKPIKDVNRRHQQVRQTDILQENTYTQTVLTCTHKFPIVPW